jgi:hypothetical protein
MIASTSVHNETRLQAVANGFGFVGLALDILGTSFGVMHAVALRASIQRIPEMLRSRTDKRLQSFINDLHENIESRTNVALQDVLHTLQVEISERRKFWIVRRFHSTAPAHPSFNLHVKSLFNAESIFRRILLLPVIQMDVTYGLGEAPMLAMAAGIGCLLISVICFAAYSQPYSVWVICVAITALAVYVSTGGLWLHSLGASFMCCSVSCF